MKLIQSDTYANLTVTDETHALAHVVLGAHQVLHLRAELLVEPLKLLLGIQGLLQGAGHGQSFGVLLPGLGLGPVSLLTIAG